MKPLFFSLLSVALGLGASLFFRDPAGGAKSPSLAGAISPVNQAPATPARRLSLEGGWKPAAIAWAAEDPAGFYQWLVDRGIPPGEEVLELLFSAWLERDDDAAFTAALNLPGDFQRGKTLAVMLNHTLEREGGLKLALQWMPWVEGQIFQWAQPGDAWMKSLPPDQIAASLAGMASPRGYSSSLIHQFAAFWSKTDRPAATEWLDTLGPEQRAQAFEGLMETWAKEDPEAALNYLASGAATTNERQSASRPRLELAETDPKRALGWMEETIGLPGSNAMRDIFGQWCKRASAEAREYCLGVSDPALRREYLAWWSVSAQLNNVLETLSQTPAGTDRNTILETLASKSSEENNNAALRQFVEKAGPDGIPVNTVAAISREYSKQNPEAALAWVASLPEVFHSETVGFVLSAWKDKIAASLAVERLPDGPLKEAGRRSLIGDPHDPFR